MAAASEARASVSGRDAAILQYAPLVKYVVGRQAFDPACRTKLRKSIPRELPACEALLKAFFP